MAVVTRGGGGGGGGRGLLPRTFVGSETYFREQQQAESSSHGHVCVSRAGFFGLNLFSRQFFLV